MSDPISTIILSVRTAVGIAKVVKDTGDALDRAEVKSKMAEVINALADASMELAEVKTAMAAKDARIDELNAAFEGKDEIRRVNDAYYTLDASGAPCGVALCLRCWEVDHRRRTLVIGKTGRYCPACNASYNGRMTNNFGNEGIAF